MPKCLQLEGKEFNRWTVLCQIEVNKPGTHWLCVCKCGNKKICSGHSLKSGSSKSCGCLRKEMSLKANKKHGLYNSNIYKVWNTMKFRCINPNAKNYSNYGGRGIKVCDEWKNDFMTFYKWAISKGYREGLTIDRIDNNGNYEPSNCRWICRIEQANNKRTNRFIEFNGENKTLAEWGREKNIDCDTIRWRIKKYGICEKIFYPVDINRSLAARGMPYLSAKQK